MGAKKSKESTLKSSELNEFHNMTLFSNDILMKLHDYYRHFSSIQTDDGVIDFNEFCLIIKKNDKNLTKRIFDTIDVNLDGSINFREFIKFISVFINGTLDEQIALSYKIFSNPETKVIEAQTMCDLLRDVVTAEESLSNFFTKELIDLIVKETFLKIGGSYDEPIQLEKYTEMVARYPLILNWLKVDIEKIKKMNLVRKLKKTNCFGK
jgi:Ca2+-binding EF-hand superfamily protein